MLTFDEARKIGLNACIDQLGRDFVKKYADSSSSAFGQIEDAAYCFVGVEPNPDMSEEKELILSEKRQFSYRVSCMVSMKNGDISYIEKVLPVTFEK